MARTSTRPPPAGLGLVTETPDDLDWADELRPVISERASFSPDALTGMEANLRITSRVSSRAGSRRRTSASMSYPVFGL